LPATQPVSSVLGVVGTPDLVVCGAMAIAMTKSVRPWLQPHFGTSSDGHRIQRTRSVILDL
jgi:hypothetical protein